MDRKLFFLTERFYIELLVEALHFRFIQFILMPVTFLNETGKKQEKLAVEAHSNDNVESTSSKRRSSSEATSSALTISQLHFPSIMSVPTFPVTLGFPKQSKKSSWIWNKYPSESTKFSTDLKTASSSIPA